MFSCTWSTRDPRSLAGSLPVRLPASWAVRTDAGAGLDRLAASGVDHLEHQPPVVCAGCQRGRRGTPPVKSSLIPCICMAAMATAEAAVLGMVMAGRLALVLPRQAHFHSRQDATPRRPGARRWTGVPAVLCHVEAVRSRLDSRTTRSPGRAGIEAGPSGSAVGEHRRYTRPPSPYHPDPLGG